MKKILLLISLILITVACKKDNEGEKYSQEEHKTIENFIKNRLEDFDVKILNIDILQNNNITASNIKVIKESIQKLSIFIANPSVFPKQPTDTIIKAYNELLNIPTKNKEHPIGKIILIKASIIGNDKIEQIGYFSLVLNKKGNIPAHIDDLLND